MIFHKAAEDGLMFTNKRRQGLACASVLSVLALAGFAAGQAATTPVAQPEQHTNAAEPVGPESRYSRVIESAKGDSTRLELSIRTFRSSKPGEPVVHLVGAVHIGDQVYYDELQKFLNAQDLVLFEGVKPAGTGSELENADDAAKVKLTKARQRMLAILLERFKRKQGEYPASIDDLIAKLPGTSARLASSAAKDAWGHPQQYVANGTPIDSFDLVSLGSDNAAGGEGGAADLKFSAQKPLTKKERTSSGDGIQVQLAEALGLKFQLASIDYTKPTWRNSDMGADEVQSRLEESGASAEALFSLLDGSSLASRLMSVLLGFVKANPQLSLSMKVMLVQTLGSTEDAMGMPARGMGMESMQAMMKVIVIDRNEVVFNDLKKVIDSEKQIKTVAIFYGAGHLPDMERRLTDEMGYVFDHDQWLPAISLDLTGQPGAAAMGRQIREQMRKMAEQQRKKDE
jgi:hypothetical protein